MKKSAGFRNVAVHAYDRIDWNIVFAIASHHLQDFKDEDREEGESLYVRPGRV